MDLATKLYEQQVARMRADAALARAKVSFLRMSQKMKAEGIGPEGDPDEEKRLDARTEARAVNGGRL